MTGYLWAILSGLGFGLFQVFNRRASLVLDYRLGTFGLLVISSLVLVLLSLTTEGMSFLTKISVHAVLYFALGGLLQFFLGWTFLTKSQQEIGAPRTGALISTAPCFAILFGFLFFGEILSWLAILAVAMIVVGILLLADG